MLLYPLYPLYSTYKIERCCINTANQKSLIMKTDSFDCNPMGPVGNYIF